MSPLMKPHEIITVEKEENVLLLKTMCLYKLLKKNKPLKFKMKWQVNTIEAKHISKQNNKCLRLKNFFNLLLCLCCFSSHGCRQLLQWLLNGLLRHTKMPERQQQMVWYHTCQQTCGTLWSCWARSDLPCFFGVVINSLANECLHRFYKVTHVTLINGEKDFRHYD